MVKPALTAICAAMGIVTFALPALAQSTGLDGLHDKRREGNRICMSDHFHDGTGSGKTRKLAEADAANVWASFTAWEYGAAWGNFKNAATKSIKCTDSGGTYSCNVSARPCRTGR